MISDYKHSKKEMSCASIRISIQWLPDGPIEELTETLVLTSAGGHFVDLRRLKDGTMDWMMSGKEKELQSNPLRLEFQHDINSHILPNYTGFNDDNPKFDTGDFEDLEDGDRLETGCMFNLDSGMKQEYREVWRTVDALKSGINGYVRKEDDTQPPAFVLKTSTEGYIGTVVKLGNLLQGILLEKKSNKISCCRWFNNTKIFSIGDEIPTSTENLTINGIRWDKIE